MARQTFTWHPDVQSQISYKPSVNVTRFGDGYEVRTAVGINSVAQRWSVKFFRAPAEGAAIDAFLKARGALESFYWNTPENIRIIVVCREWNITRITGGILEISCNFEQVFEA